MPQSNRLNKRTLICKHLYCQVKESDKVISWPTPPTTHKLLRQFQATNEADFLYATQFQPNYVDKYEEKNRGHPTSTRGGGIKKMLIYRRILIFF